jgi:hypothetical protein
MDPLLAALQPDQQHPFRKLAIRADNARIHMSEMVDEYFESHRLQRDDRPLPSPGLARSDFFLFGFIEEQLKRTYFPNGQALTH